MLEGMCRDEYLFYCNVWFIRTRIQYMLLWYIANGDWFIRTSTTGVCVTLLPNFKQARGYPHIEKRKKCCPKLPSGKQSWICSLTHWEHASIKKHYTSHNFLGSMDGKWTNSSIFKRNFPAMLLCLNAMNKIRYLFDIKNKYTNTRRSMYIISLQDDLFW